VSDKKIFSFVMIFLFGLISLLHAWETPQDPFNQELLKCFQYRNIGPFRSGAWITDFAVPESPEKEHLGS